MMDVMMAEQRDAERFQVTQSLISAEVSVKSKKMTPCCDV